MDIMHRENSHLKANNNPIVGDNVMIIDFNQ